MHPCLSEFPSNTFYEGTLQNGAGAGDRRGGTPAFPWPKPEKPMMFWAQLGAEEISASGEGVAAAGLWRPAPWESCGLVVSGFVRHQQQQHQQQVCT
jgi:hypothetical protein